MLHITDAKLTNVKNKYDGCDYQIIGNRAFFTICVETTVAMNEGTYYEILDLSNIGLDNSKIRYIDVNGTVRVQANYRRINVLPLTSAFASGKLLIFEFSIPVTVL